MSCVCSLLFLVVVSACVALTTSTCEDSACGTLGDCFTGSCPSGKAVMTWPPGAQLCAGASCTCCANDDKVKCYNEGGSGCADDFTCNDGWELIPDVGGEQLCTADDDRVCCARVTDKPCLAVSGVCRTSCGSKHVAIPNSIVQCGCNEVCCVHTSREKCAMERGTCFETDDCPSGYISAGPPSGKCVGSGLKCCIENP